MYVRIFNKDATTYFLEDSINYGEVSDAVFFDNTINNGPVYGHACFNDTSTNNALVYGDAYISSTATVPPSTILGDILPAGVPIYAHLDCNIDNSNAITLYIHQDDLLVIGSIIYTNPFYNDTFEGEFVVSSVKYITNDIGEIINIDACDLYSG